VEIVDPAEVEKHHHAWLEWVGLEAPPPDAEAWVAVARGFLPDGSGAQTSRLAGQLVEALGRAKIDARQRTYQFYNADAGSGVGLLGPATVMETCVAVVVHDRDLHRGVAVAESIRDQLQTEAREPLSGELSDAELTRQALAAGPPPPD
jgi:hypothetical protein